MTVFLEYIRRKLGWCPNAGIIEPVRRTSAEAGYGDAWKGRSPEPDPGPEPAGTAGGDRSGYLDNMLLILLALAWLFPVVYQREFLPSNRSGIPVSRSWYEGFSLECSPDGRDYRPSILPHR